MLKSKRMEVKPQDGETFLKGTSLKTQLGLSSNVYQKIGSFLNLQKGRHFIYSPLHGWATQKALEDSTKTSAFDFVND